MPEVIYGPWLPPDISVHGHHVDRLISILHWFMGVLFVGWGIFFAYCLVRFRQREGHEAGYEQTAAKPAKYSEVAVVLFEAFVLIGMSMPVWASVKNDFPPESEALRIHVVAEQFAWNIHYAGADGIFGATSPEFVSPFNLIGLDEDDEDGYDDVVTNNIMHIPNDRPIIVDLTSKDVIHSFSIPVMRVKQDVIPGMKIPIWFEVAEGKTGHFEVGCAQLCGNNHYTMKADLYVDSAEDFASWLAEMSSDEEEEEDDEDEDEDA